MTQPQQLSLFISSKMRELLKERQAVQVALKEYSMYGWLWEKDAGARPESVRATYLKQVEACDLYIGLFWLGYGPYTIEEYEHARQQQKPCLIYEKHVDMDQRDPQLKAFLKQVNNVGEGLTICRFSTTEELATRVKQDVIRLLTEALRKKQASASPRPSGSGTISASGGSIAAGSINNSQVNVNNYGRTGENEA